MNRAIVCMVIDVGMHIQQHPLFQINQLSILQNVVSAKKMFFRQINGLVYYKVLLSLHYHIDCNHVFCLECIRNWRYSHIGDPNVSEWDRTHLKVRKCPICKATSFYVIPSNVPIFDPEVKQRLINKYKENMSSKIW